MAEQSEDSSVEELVGEIILAHRAKILSAYDELLAQADSPLLTSAAARNLHRQSAAVLDEVCARLLPATAPRIGNRQSSATDRAPRAPEIHPRDAPWAGAALSRAVLTTVAEQLPDRPDLVSGIVRLAVILQVTTTERLMAGAIAYLSYLSQQLRRSHADERRRIARELHDLVAQSLAVALQNLELYSVWRQTDDEQAARKLDTARAALRDTIDLVRALTQDLRRSGAEEGLVAALRGYAATMVPDTMRCHLHVSGDEERVPPAIRGELFLILREALHNACRHSGASRIDVDVTIEAQLVRAGVVDDGRGFDPSGPTAGAGFASMRERAALLAGRLEVSSLAGHGTTVHVEVPLKARDGSG
jgi:signal transduction histidine kinase